MVKIRPLRLEDFNTICEMLNMRGIEPPVEPSDCAGVFLIAEDNGLIKGSIYALIGASTKAYVDYYFADSAYIGWMLLQTLETILKLHGIKRIDFAIENNNNSFERLAIKYGCEKLRDLKWFRREL